MNKFTCMLVVLFLFLFTNLNYAQPGLGSAANFAVFTSSGAFNSSNTTMITGNIGTVTGPLNGFPPGLVLGQTHVADATATQAALDLKTAYGAFSALPCGAGGVLGVTLGSGQILTPNTYCTGAATTLTGNLILDAQGNPNALFIFQIGGAFASAGLSSITLRNGASLCNVYWQIGGAVTLGSNSSFLGTILADGQIQLLSSATLSGRALTRAGAVVLDNNKITGIIAPVASTITASGATTFCAGGSVTLSGNVGGVFNTGATTGSIVVTASGDYFVTNTGTCGTVTSNHIIVIVNPVPTPTITSGPLNFCAGGAVVLTSSAAAGNLFSTGATTQSITVTTSGTYTVTVTDANGCQGTSAPVTVVVTPNGVPTLTASGPLTFCAGGSVVLTSSAATGNVFSTGATTQSITVTTSGTYTVTTSGACGGTSAPIKVTVNPLPTPTITATGPLTFCAGGYVILTSSSPTATSTLFSTGANTPSIVVTTSGTYTATVTDANGCQATTAPVTVVVTPNGIPTLTASGPLTFCAGGNVVLTSSAATGNLFSTGATTQSITVTTSGTYTVTAGGACGGTSAPIIVTVNPVPIPTLTASGPLTFCAGGSVVLTSSAASGNLFSTGATTQSITVTTSGTYTVTVMNANGCKGTSAAVVVVVTPNGIPTLTASGPLTFCAGGSVVLTSSAATGNVFSTGATTQSITVTTSGTYTVTAGGQCGGTSAAVTVTVNPCRIINIPVTQPTCDPLLGGTTTSVCVLNPTTFVTTCTITTYVYVGTPAFITVMGPMLMASAGVSYQFFLNGVAISGATQQMYFPTTFGNYTVQVTNSAGCVSTSQVIRSNVDYGNNCPDIHKNFCDPCNDGNPNTINDRVRNDCKCRGDFFSPNITVRCPKDTIVLTTSRYGTVVNFNVAFSTNCKIGRENWVDVVQTSGYYSGYPFPPDSRTQIELVGTDMCGNKSSCSFMVRTTPLQGAPVLSLATPDVSVKPIIDNKVSGVSSIQAHVFPNPVKNSANIEFSNSGEAAHLFLEVFNTNGEKVARLFDGEAATNELYNVKLDAANLPNGVYFYRITGGTESFNGRIVLLK